MTNRASGRESNTMKANPQKVQDARFSSGLCTSARLSTVRQLYNRKPNGGSARASSRTAHWSGRYAGRVLLSFPIRSDKLSMNVLVTKHVAHTRTQFQTIDIYDTEVFGRVLFLDGHVQLSE